MVAKDSIARLDREPANELRRQLIVDLIVDPVRTPSTCTGDFVTRHRDDWRTVITPTRFATAAEKPGRTTPTADEQIGAISVSTISAFALDLDSRQTKPVPVMVAREAAPVAVNGPSTSKSAVSAVTRNVPTKADRATVLLWNFDSLGIMSSLLVSRTIRVNAPAQEIFNLLADPGRHHEIDGSGTVTGSKQLAPARLSNGARFGMSMKLGVPYKITNEVIEFEEGRVIAWRHFGKHTWRYQLEPISDNATQVTETFDGTTSRLPFALSITGAGKRNARAIEATLTKLSAHFDVAAK
jgi:Polyketide cyclase / dehydrase and lipid transport